jgi:hypothetical protein
VSPFLFWPIGRFLFAREGAVPAVRPARIAFIVSSVSILGVALFTAVLFHWNLIAYAAMLPFLAFYFRPRWLLPLQALYGIVFAVAAFINYAITPLTPVAAWRDEATAWSYGWSDIAAAVSEAKAANPVSFVAASDYTTASLLGFALRDKDVVSLSPHTDEYDYWFDPAAHAGQDAILVTDIWRGLYPEVKRKFESVKRLQVVPVLRNGIELNRVSILLAKGFKPDG